MALGFLDVHIEIGHVYSKFKTASLADVLETKKLNNLYVVSFFFFFLACHLNSILNRKIFDFEIHFEPHLYLNLKILTKYQKPLNRSGF